MATNTSDFYTYSKTAGTAKNLQKPTVAGDTNVWGTSLNLDLDIVVAAVNAMSDLIADASQNELIDFTATGSAVNHIGITNAATGNAPSIAAIGDDTNINLTLAPKGSGEVDISKVDIDSGAIDGITLGTNSAVAEADIDNININGNTISSTDSNGDINLDCNGTGDIECSSDVKTSTTKKVYSKGNCFQTSFHASLVFGN